MEIVLTPNQAILVGLFAVFAIFILLFLLKLCVRRLFGPRRDDHVRTVIRKKWNDVDELMAMRSIHGYKLAVLEADKLFDLALKALYLPGENMGQRLKVCVARNPGIQPVWGAHVIRNKIAHDTHFELLERDALRAVRVFNKGLRDLGFLP